MVKDVDQKQNGQCRSNRFGSHWPFTLATHILISLSFKSFGGLGAFGGMGGCGPPSPGVSGSTSLGWVPSLRTEIHPRLAVSLLFGPSPTLPLRVAPLPAAPSPPVERPPSPAAAVRSCPSPSALRSTPAAACPASSRYRRVPCPVPPTPGTAPASCPGR